MPISSERESRLKRSLNTQHIRALALGNMMRAALFVGSGAVIAKGGPVAFIADVMMGVIVCALIAAVRLYPVILRLCNLSKVVLPFIHRQMSLPQLKLSSRCQGECILKLRAWRHSWRPLSVNAYIVAVLLSMKYEVESLPGLTLSV